MSCKKNYLQLTHLFIKALLLIFIFSSCSKEEFYLPENPEPIPDHNPNIKLDKPLFFSSKEKQDASSNLELENVQRVLNIENLIRDLTLNTFYGTYFYPQLRGLIGTSSADVRNDCPESTLGTSGGVSTLTLVYNNCKTLSGATYDGTITVRIEGDLEVGGTCVKITLGPGFTVDNGTLNGSLSMIYDSGTMGYNISELALTNTSDLGDETSVEIGASGNGGIITVDVVGTNSGPLDLINDNFIYEAAHLEVTCPGRNGPEVLSAEIMVNMVYNIPCGIPQEGMIQLNKMVDGSPYAQIDFEHGSFDMPGGCDNLVAVFLDSDPTTLIQVTIE